MIRQTAIALVLAATAVLTPLSAVAETPVTGTRTQLQQPAARVQVQLYNKFLTVGQVMIDDKIYNVDRLHVLTIKAPAGTVVYAYDNIPSHRKGEAIMTIGTQMQNRNLLLN